MYFSTHIDVPFLGLRETDYLRVSLSLDHTNRLFVVTRDYVDASGVLRVYGWKKLKTAQRAREYFLFQVHCGGR